MIKKISPDNKLFQFLFLKYDFHNIRTLIKLKLKEQKNFSDNLVSFGTCDSQKIANYILLDNLKDFSDEFLKSSINNILKNSSLETVDSLCDKEYFKLFLNIAKKIKDEFLIKIVLLEIDFANLRIILRTEKEGERRMMIKDFYIPGGKINLNKLLKIHSEKNNDSVINYLKFYLNKDGQKIFEKFFNEKKMWQFEQAFDNFFMSELKLVKFKSFGPAIITAYVLSKEIAFRNIRIIMNAKINEIPAEIIKERIRNIF